MALTGEQIRRIKKMKHDDLIANAQTEDLAVVVEASLRLHRATIILNLVLIVLTAALVYFTYGLLHYATPASQTVVPKSQARTRGPAYFRFP